MKKIKELNDKNLSTLKEDILHFLRTTIRLESQVTNWHLSDNLLDFWDSFFPEEKSLNKVKKKFTYYATILVKEGELHSPERIGLGCGGKFEWGTQTQTIWRKRNFVKEYNGVTRDLQNRITHIDGKSIYCYSAEELNKFRADGKFREKSDG